jgi:curli biogenesis system outer membrane secretion channel CsgG
MGMGALLVPAVAVAEAPVRVSVQGFGSSGLLGASATEESLVTLLIEELVADGGWAVVDDSGGTAGPGAPLLMRGVITKFEAGGGSGLDLGGMGGRLGGHGGVKSETFSLALSLRLLDPASRQVLAVAAGAATAKASGLRGGVDLRRGGTVGGERVKNPAVEQAVRDALKQAIGKLSTAAAKLPAG